MAASAVSMNVFAQDQIHQRSGEVLEVKVKEIEENDISFVYPNEEIINHLAPEKVEKIVFESGREQLFEAVVSANTNGLDVEEPEFVGGVLHINEDNELMPLEKQKSSRKVSATAGKYIGGFGKESARLVFPGKTSSVRLSAEKPLQFLVKVENNNYDPSEAISILKMKRKGKNRFIETGKVNMIGQIKSSDLDLADFEAEKYGESSFLITVAGLEPGEYGITLNGSGGDPSSDPILGGGGENYHLFSLD